MIAKLSGETSPDGGDSSSDVPSALGAGGSDLLESRPATTASRVRTSRHEPASRLSWDASMSIRRLYCASPPLRPVPPTPGRGTRPVTASRGKSSWPCRAHPLRVAGAAPRLRSADCAPARGAVPSRGGARWVGAHAAEWSSREYPSPHDGRRRPRRRDACILRRRGPGARRITRCVLPEAYAYHDPACDAGPPKQQREVPRRSNSVDRFDEFLASLRSCTRRGSTLAARG